jgi:hypothetical protein
MTIWTNKDFQERVKEALIDAFAHVSADANSLRECSTNKDGTWDDDSDLPWYEHLIERKNELERLLKEI